MVGLCKVEGYGELADVDIFAFLGLNASQQYPLALMRAHARKLKVWLHPQCKSKDKPDNWPGYKPETANSIGAFLEGEVNERPPKDTATSTGISPEMERSRTRSNNEILSLLYREATKGHARTWDPFSIPRPGQATSAPGLNPSSSNPKTPQKAAASGRSSSVPPSSQTKSKRARSPSPDAGPSNARPAKRGMRDQGAPDNTSSTFSPNLATPDGSPFGSTRRSTPYSFTPPQKSSARTSNPSTPGSRGRQGATARPVPTSRNSGYAASSSGMPQTRTNAGSRDTRIHRGHSYQRPASVAAESDESLIGLADMDHGMIFGLVRGQHEAGNVQPSYIVEGYLDFRNSMFTKVHDRNLDNQPLAPYSQMARRIASAIELSHRGLEFLGRFKASRSRADVKHCLEELKAGNPLP